MQMPSQTISKIQLICEMGANSNEEKYYEDN